MEKYILYKRNKNKKVLIFITILFSIVFAVLYYFYANINVNRYNIQPKIEKVSQEIAVNEKENKTNITDMIEKATLSVVGISKIKDTGNTIFQKNGITKLGLGTGIIVTGDGYILTNEHVSGEKYSTCYVTLETGNEYKGNVVWADKDIDLSIIKINVKNLKYAKLGDSDKTKVGESVYAIGNPIGYEFQRTVTSGIISAIDRTIKIEEEGEEPAYLSNLIQTDATINFGNSGGPLINTDGEVIGVNSLKITSAEGISFALPINLVKEIIQRFANEGFFEEASIGIFAYDKNVIPYLESNLKFDTGIYVAQIKENSSAYASGLKEKDIILSIDNIKLEKMCDLRKYIYTKNIGDEVNLKILRNGLEKEINMKLIKK